MYSEGSPPKCLADSLLYDILVLIGENSKKARHTALPEGKSNMKKDQRVQHEFDYLKKQYPKIKQQVAETKNNKLWHHEAIIRNKIKEPAWSFGFYNRKYDNRIAYEKMHEESMRDEE